MKEHAGMRLETPKILIVTAGYGDGHNSAARGIAEALEGRADCRVRDIIALAEPFVFKYSRKGYLWTISCAPSLWRLLYDWTDSVDMSQEPMAGMGRVKERLEREVNEFRPDFIICTYMLYPYLLDKLFLKTGKAVPYLTVVTDSLEINKSWLCSNSPMWAVTDLWTRQVMADRGLDDRKIMATGFPVSPSLKKLSNDSVLEPGGGFRVLFFPQGRAKCALRMLEAILESDPCVQVTCVLGRHFRKYYPSFSRLLSLYGDRLGIRGWTRKVPQLMASHHLVVGKAGGATSHECIAMARPMIVNFRTPGQEEGNIALLEKLGGGRFAETPQELKETLRLMLENDRTLWKSMHSGLKAAAVTDGAEKIAGWCLERISGNEGGDADLSAR